MEAISAILVALLLLVLGDFFSTFLYHVPEHVFGKFHTAVHHSDNRSFLHYAVLSKNPLVLVDGLLGAVPYFMFIPWLWNLSPAGTLIGLLLGEFHVMWRHTSLLKWKTPERLDYLCNLLWITTPERHWLHHQNSSVAYGDIFTFYDRPARAWLRVLRLLKRRLRKTTAKQETSSLS